MALSFVIHRQRFHLTQKVTDTIEGSHPQGSGWFVHQRILNA